MLPRATIKAETFPVAASSGAAPAAAVKRTERNFFQSRKEAKDPKPVNELRTFLKEINERQQRVIWP